MLPDTRTDYDAIIVGARCAGAPTAMLLARKGYRVMLLDRARFPADSVNGYQLRVRGLTYLKKWGLLDALVATGVPQIRRTQHNAGPAQLTGNVFPLDGIDFESNPRRYVLDALLADAAVAAGAEFHDGLVVDALTFDGDRVTGITARRSGGRSVTIGARIVIGADGANSFVARALGVPKYHEVPSMGFNYLAHWSGVADAMTESHLASDAFVGVFPTHGGLAGIAVAMPPEGFAAFRQDIERNVLRTVERFPALAERLRAGRREDRFTGMAGVDNFFRKPYGDGWALVGDAGYTRDPAMAQGMTDAFRDAERLASAIDDGFAGRATMSDALAAYHRERDAAALPMYRLITRTHPGAARIPELMRACAGDQAELDRLFASLAGTIAVDEYFAPENIARILEERAVAA
jgi:2-polyprenyl-6-methoxyphenol hydroxylase-like FAD-dependent oxidoreductase